MTEANDNAPKGRRNSIDTIRDTLMNESEKRPTARRRSVTSGHSITGNGNIVGDGNVINHIHNPPVEKKIVIVKTGDGVIDASQKLKINNLIKNWAETRDAVRKSPAEIKALRYGFNQYMKVNSYHEIKGIDFEKAIRWLQRQTGIVNSMPSARTKNPNWRKSRYTAIKTRSRKFENGNDRCKQYIESKFNATSLTNLDDEQLEKTYRYVMGWR